MSEENKKQLPKLEDMGQIELPKFDPTPFIGVKAMVDEIIVKSAIQKDGKESFYIQFKALVDPTGFNVEPLYANRNVGVQIDEHHKVNHPSEMKGKEVIVQTQPDSTYLTF